MKAEKDIQRKEGMGEKTSRHQGKAARRPLRSAKTRRAIVAVAVMMLAFIVAGCTPSSGSSASASSTSEASVSASASTSASTDPAGSTISVHVIVDCNDPVQEGIREAVAICPSGIMFDETLTLPQATTALDGLKATGLTVSMAPGAFVYVNGINSLAERITNDYPMSGWMFYINGEMAMDSCDNIVLNDGDELLWKYSLTFE